MNRSPRSVHLIIGALSFTLLAVLVLNACAAPGASATSSASPTSSAAARPATSSAAATTAEPAKPGYGGVLSIALAADQKGFDAALVARFSTYQNIETGNTLLEADWSKGPAGSDLTDFSGSTAAIPMNTGSLSETW